MTEPEIPAGAVVVGVDGSEHSDRAVVWATEVAHNEHRTLVLVHAVHHVPPWVAAAAVDVAALNRDAAEAADRLLASHRARIESLPGAPVVEVLSSTDDAREVLLRLSAHAHLVVLGTRGRGPTERLLLGSVTSAVVRQSVCPVVVVRDGDEPPGTGVVVGIGGGRRSAAVLDLAFRAASWRREPLTVVYCFFDVESAEGEALAAPVHSDLAAEHLLVSESLAGFGAEYPDVKVDVELGRGLAEDVLVDLSRGAALVVVGSSRHSAMTDFLLGSVATALVEHAHCPVAVVPDRSPGT